jgi:O-antigen/teichoic acid export membrane protein
MLKIIAGNFSVRFFSALANLLIAIIISQSIGAAGKGEQSIILLSITIILLFSNLVGGASIVYLTSRIGTQNIIVTSYLWTCVVTVLCYFVLNLLPGLSMKYSISISLLSGLNSLSSINSSILIGKEKIQKSNLVNLCIPALTLLTIGFLFYYLGQMSIRSYLTASFLAYFTSFLLGSFFLFLEKSSNGKIHLGDIINTFKALFFYGFQNQLAHIFQLLNFRLNYFLLEAHSGQKAVGIYSNALSIAESIWLITGSICLYQYARISNSTNDEYARKLTEQFIKIGLFLAFIALVIIILIPSSFYVWLFGKEFHELNLVIIYMAPGVWVFNYSLFLGHYFSGKGKFYVNALASFGGLIITLILSLICVAKLDIFNSAVIAVISYTVTASIVVFYYLKEGGRFVVFPTLNEIRKIKSLFGSKFSN